MNRIRIAEYVVTGVKAGGGREILSRPCSRLEAIDLRNWTRFRLGDIKVYHDIQIREIQGHSNNIL